MYSSNVIKSMYLIHIKLLKIYNPSPFSNLEEPKKDSDRTSQSVEETILQKLCHAIRVHNIRYIKFVTDAHFDRNSSVVAGANTINQLALSHVVYSAGPKPSLKDSDFLQSKVFTIIPGKTFADAFLSRQKEPSTGKIVNVGRFPWDKNIGESVEVPPYGLFIVRPKSNVDATLIPAWYEDVSIPAKFIKDIKVQIVLLETNLNELRVILHDLVYPDVAEFFEDPDKKSNEDWIELFGQYFHVTERNPLLKRRYGCDDSLTNQLRAPYSYNMAFECTKRDSNNMKPAFSVILENFTFAVFDIQKQIVSVMYCLPNYCFFFIFVFIAQVLANSRCHIDSICTTY